MKCRVLFLLLLLAAPMARADLGGGDRAFLIDELAYSRAQMHLAEFALHQSLSESAGLYARGMASYHQKLYGQLLKLARSKGLQLDGSADGWRSDPELERLQGPAFERGYARQQVEWQRREMAQLRDESEQAQDMDLKTYAAARLPAIERHLGMAQALLDGQSNEASAHP